MAPIGKVFLVGAGPGDPDLLTLKGKRCLEAADVVLYDALANPALLAFVRGDAARIYVGKRPGEHCANQREIENLLMYHASQGRNVVRLKGGDPLVFGRGGEEALALSRAAIPFEIVPGVSSALAVPAYAGIPVTHRSVASSFAVVTGHRASGDGIKWGALARAVDTLVILMGWHNLDAIMTELVAGGCEPERPVGLVQAGTSAAQRVLSATVATIGALAAHLKFRPPVLIVVGDVVRLSQQLRWFGAVHDGLPIRGGGSECDAVIPR